MIILPIEACCKGGRKFPKTKGRGKKRSTLITKELFLLKPLGDGKTLFTL